jgi:quinol monooxygenase YgiN
MIFIAVKHPVRSEYADDWPTLIEEFTTATRAEPGTLWFDWYRTMTRIPALLAGNSEIVNVDS